MLKVVPVMLALVLAPMYSGAASIQCGNAAIFVGSRSEELINLCGKPSQIIRGRDLKWNAEGPPVRGTLTGGPDKIDSEFWIYEFGPSQLMQSVVIRNGLVTNLESLGFGSNET